MIRNANFQFSLTLLSGNTSNKLNMYGLMLILVFTTRVASEVQSMQYHMHVSRKSRSNAAPYETGYVFSQLNNDPGTLETFVNGGSGFNSIPMVPNVGNSDTMTMKYGDAYSLKYSDKTKMDNDSPMAKYSDMHNDKDSEQTTKYNSSPIDKYSSIMHKEKYNDQLPKYNSATMTDWPLSKSNEHVQLSMPLSLKDIKSTNPSTYITFTEPPMTEHAMDYAIAKSEAEYESKYLPSKIISDALYERLKSVMHYEPSPESMSEYGHTTDFHMDDNDIRTSSRIPYENWPYSYPMPYEYEHMKVDNEIQKAKDKRYAIDTGRKIIPVHEHNEYDVPLSNSHYTHTTPEATTPDNPITGNQPFFSFVLNDYFQKNDDDPLTFKGMDWGNDFDYQGGLNDIDSESGKRNRRLQTNYHQYPSDNNGGTNGQYNHNHNTINTAKGESATEKGYKKKHEFEKHEKGDDIKANHNSGYEQKGNNYIGFKDFTDSFANKFGGEDYKKDSKYILKNDQDKSEKRKGFRRVYHKDEYQEDNEFYDNTNKLAKAEEKGSTSAHNGGSHAYIKSNAAAAVGNEANAYNKAGNTDKSNFQKNHSGHGMQKGLDSDYNRYRDVAKKAAQSNNADYIDSFRT